MTFHEFCGYALIGFGAIMVPVGVVFALGIIIGGEKFPDEGER